MAPSDPSFDLQAPADEVARLAANVRDDQLDDPTPSDIPVAGLLDHLMGLTLAFTWAARKQLPPGGASGPPPQAAAGDLDPDWRTQLPQRLHELVEAWREPSAWQGETEAGGVRMPASEMAAVVVDELVMHGWDLARGTGQEFRCDDVSTQVVLGFTTEAAKPEFADSREGLFGPVVDVPDDSPDIDRAIALAGRDPGWSARP